MTKFLPYQQYDVQAIEQWLNEQSRKGYRLEKMDSVFPQFKKYYDHQIYYRVRYIPDNTKKNHSHYWGDLYIYEAYSKEELPSAAYEKSSILAAENQKKPYYAIALLIAMLTVARALFSGVSTTPVFVGSACVAVIAMLVWLVSIFLDWQRGRSIADGRLNPAENPPNPKSKAVLTISSIVSILATAIAVLLAETLI